MKKLAFATDSAHAQLTEGDRLLVGPLAERGIEVTAVVWDDSTVAWPSFDAVLIRSVWDYHERPDEFRAWLDRVQGLVPVYNPASLLTWNLDKHYLCELRDSGVRLIPTVWLDQGDTADLGELMASHGWDQVVIKPRVGASGYRTWRSDRTRAADDQVRFQAALNEGALMVQRFAEGIRHGEYSFVFFGGQYSHTVLKTPAPGGFFVQSEHGGSHRPVTPDTGLIAQAGAFLMIAQMISGTEALYARVDAILESGQNDGQLVLMELELIEPDLFLGEDPASVQRFAHAIAGVML